MAMGEIVKHESFGMLRVVKATGGMSLFNSPIDGGGAICIEISTAEVDRHLNHDWVHPRERLIEVWLSPLQWAEAITTGMNTEGVPCTLHAVAGKRMERCPQKDIKGQFEAEVSKGFEERMTDVVEADKLISEMLSSKGSIKKSDLKKAYDILNRGIRHFESNMNYTEKCFTESVDRTVLEAKQQIDHYVNTTIQKFGIEAMQELQSVKLVELQTITEGK